MSILYGYDDIFTLSDSSTISLSPSSFSSTISLTPSLTPRSETIVITTPRQDSLYTTTRLGAIVPRSLYPLYATLEVDDEHNNNYFTQKQMTEKIRFLVLDKWLFDDIMFDVLKYLKVSGNNVTFVKTEKEMLDNDVEHDTESELEKKADFIGDEFLTVNEMRKILSRIVGELGYKWYNLLSHEYIIIKVVAKHLRKIFNARFTK